MKYNLFFRLLSVILFSLLVFDLEGQNEITDKYVSNIIVTDTFIQKNSAYILSKLGQNYKRNIYFKNETLNNKLYNFNWHSISLNDVLEQVCINNDLNLVVYRENVYFLLPKTVVEDKEYLIKDIISKAEMMSKKDTKIWKVSGVNSGKQKSIFSGTIKDILNHEMIIGALILLNGKPITTTNEKGFFSMEMNTGVNEIQVDFIGYASFKRTFEIDGEVNYKINLEREAELLDEVVISSVSADASVKETQIGITRLDIKSLERIPLFLGERDVVKAVLLNPGVSSIGEGSSGFNVRGGSVDQNLILQDDAILFNSSHALGFFSTFNADILKSATLSKGNIGASFGGRLSSVLDVKTSEEVGSLKYKLSLNPVSTSGYLEMPLSKSSSIIAAGRTTFSNFIFNLLSIPELKNSKATFYDLNLKYIHKYRKNVFTVSGYYSDDLFEFNQKFGFAYSTKIVQGAWKKLINTKSSNRISLVWSNYSSNQKDFVGQQSSIFNTNVNYYKLSEKFITNWNNVNWELGITSLYYMTNPGSFYPLNSTSTKVVEILERENALESASYISSEFKIFNWLDVVIGARYNHFVFLGPKSEYVYQDNVKAESNIIDTTYKNGIIKTYTNFEPRLSSKVNLSKSSSLKFGYAKTSQFINQIFNTDTPSPSSQWQLSNTHILPGESQNFSLGIFKNIHDNNIELSIEGYYRNILRIYDYKDFAKLLVNSHIETELLEGVGKSSGVEVGIKKSKGVINGFISYTYSKAILKIEGINNGNWYRSNFDKPHNLSLILNYQPIEKRTFTANFTFSTGRPSTAPISNYITPDNVYVPIYSDRNQIRIPDTHRLDLSANFGRTHNKAAKIKTSWTFTLYNVYGRKNPFSLFYTRGFNNLPQTNRLAVIGTVFPSLSFNIEFL